MTCIGSVASPVCYGLCFTHDDVPRIIKVVTIQVSIMFQAFQRDACVACVLVCMSLVTRFIEEAYMKSIWEV